MKKILTAIISMLTVIAMCAVIAGCATNVSGKTFAFSDVEANYNEGEMTDFEKAAVNLVIEGIKSTFKNSKYEFSAEDDTVKRDGIPAGTYKQDGDKVTITGVTSATTELTVSGKNLKVGYEKDNYKFYLVYAQK